ncbi:hypothetical protein BHM03_00004641 [Ensete ventricosum]|nr:hypothetical protein BHM03_00004641 [Ensete ventricosum]
MSENGSQLPKASTTEIVRSTQRNQLKSRSTSSWVGRPPGEIAHQRAKLMPGLWSKKGQSTTEIPRLPSDLKEKSTLTTTMLWSSQCALQMPRSSG